MINVTTATTAELVAFHNANSATPVKKFQDRKTAEARVTKIVQQLELDNAAKLMALPKVTIKDVPESLTKKQAVSLGKKPAVTEPSDRLALVKATVKEPSPAAIHLEAQAYLKTLSDSTPVMLRIRLVLDKFPGMTRIELKHTAASVGINPLTARNHFDKVRGTK